MGDGGGGDSGSHRPDEVAEPRPGLRGGDNTGWRMNGTGLEGLTSSEEEWDEAAILYGRTKLWDSRSGRSSFIVFSRAGLSTGRNVFLPFAEASENSQV